MKIKKTSWKLNATQQLEQLSWIMNAFKHLKYFTMNVYARPYLAAAHYSLKKVLSRSGHDRSLYLKLFNICSIIFAD